jgi:hypothetical protein
VNEKRSFRSLEGKLQSSKWRSDKGKGRKQLLYNETMKKQGITLRVVQTGSEVHPTSYPIDTGGSFPGGKADAA